MTSIIKIKRSLTPGSVPGSLQAGELAINLPDKKIFSSNGTSVFSVSGDNYNAVTQSNVAVGGADIVLTVDNDSLSNDAITLVGGGGGINVARAGNGAITFTDDGTGSAATLTTPRNIGGVSFDGSANINLPGVNTEGNQNTTGSAATLTTARTIGGVSFDGSSNINLPGVNTAGNQDTSGNAATATRLAGTGVTIGGVAFNGTINIDLAGVNIIGNQDTTGNAATATALETARNIGGVSFDGTSNIDLPGVNTTGNQNTTGSAAKLTTARAIALTGDASGTANFDGSAGISITTTLADSISANTSGTAAKATILETARNIGGVSFDGSANINLPGVNAEGNQNTTGSAATLTTPRTIGGVAFDGSANITLPGVNAAGSQDTTGNAATATALATPRTIGGVSFDGTSNINLPGVNAEGNQNTTGSAATLTTARAIALTGDASGTANFDGSAGISITTTLADSVSANTSGNAATATKLATARAIALTGDVAGSANFDGSAGISIAATVQPNSVALGTDTTGNYAASVTGTAGEIEVTGVAGEGTSFQIGLPNDITIGNDVNVVNDATVGGNLTVDGNLDVNGTLTFIDSTTVTIGDNMLKLANTNIADTVDTGFYVQYNDGAEKFAGLVRDATDGSFHLFHELTTEPDQQIAFGSTSQATLNATIDGGTY